MHSTYDTLRSLYTPFVHYPGYLESRRKVSEYSLSDLFNLIDALQGRDNITDQTNLAEVRAEALRQHEIEWRAK